MKLSAEIQMFGITLIIVAVLAIIVAVMALKNIPKNKEDGKSGYSNYG